MLYTHTSGNTTVLNCETYKRCTHGCRYCFSNINWHDYYKITLGKKTKKNIDQAFFSDNKKLKKNDGTPYYDLYQEKQFLQGKGRYASFYKNREPIRLGNAVDPFSDFEKYYRQTYRLLLMIRKEKYPILITTKSDWIYKNDKYLEILGNNCIVMTSIPSLDREFAKKIEPKSSLEGRIQLLQALIKKKKIRKVGIRIEPFIIGISDIDISHALEYYSHIGVDFITMNPLKIGYSRFAENQMKSLQKYNGIDYITLYKNVYRYKRDRNWRLPEDMKAEYRRQLIKLAGLHGLIYVDRYKMEPNILSMNELFK